MRARHSLLRRDSSADDQAKTHQVCRDCFNLLGVNAGDNNDVVVTGISFKQ